MEILVIKHEKFNHTDLNRKKEKRGTYTKALTGFQSCYFTALLRSLRTGTNNSSQLGHYMSCVQ